MAIQQPWNVVFAIGFVVYVLTRGKFARLSRGNETVATRAGVQEKLLLFAMLTSGLLFPVIYLFTPLFAFANYQLPGWLHFVGLVFMVVGCGLFGVHMPTWG